MNGLGITMEDKITRGYFYGTPELRKKLKNYYIASEQSHNRWIESGYSHKERTLARYPEECRGMLCGAKTRSGKPCKNDGATYANGRCKFHGGMSTGPQTPKGKRQSAENGRNHKPKPMNSW